MATGMNMRAEELLARAFLHEIDHLDGHLYPEIAEKMLTAEELRRG